MAQQSEWARFGDPRDRRGTFRPKRRLAEELERQGLSQQALAARMGVGRETVNKWINGKEHMPNRSVIRAAVILGVDPTYLLDLQAPRRADPDTERTGWASFDTNRKSITDTLKKVKNPDTTLEMFHVVINPDGELEGEYYEQAYIDRVMPDNGVCELRYWTTHIEDTPPMVPDTPDPDMSPHAFRYSDLQSLDRGYSHPQALEDVLLDELDHIPGDHRDMGRFAKDMTACLVGAYSIAAPELVSRLTPVLEAMAIRYPAAILNYGDGME